MDYSKMMKEGLDDINWGFGHRRLGVSSSGSSQNGFPYCFTAFGYKKKTGKMFLGLRMNVDQISPHKLIEWDDEPVLEKLGVLMHEFISEYKTSTSSINSK